MQTSDRTMTRPCRKRRTCLLTPVLWAISAMSMRVAQAQDDVASMIARIESPQSPAETDLDSLPLQALMERLHVPGLSIAVVKDFKIHWAKAYGVADTETGRLLDTGTRFQAASISKPVTALAAMRLVQEHRLDLDADIDTMLKSWHTSKVAARRPPGTSTRSGPPPAYGPRRAAWRSSSTKSRTVS